MTYEQIAHSIVEEAIQTDAAETERLGALRGDELPDVIATDRGRECWLRDARQRLGPSARRAAEPIARSRPERLLEAKRRLEEELDFERHANANFEALPPPRSDAQRPAHDRATKALHAARRSRRQDQSHRPRLKASCTACAAGSRATTPRPSATSATSSSPPRS